MRLGLLALVVALPAVLVGCYGGSWKYADACVQGRLFASCSKAERICKDGDPAACHELALGYSHQRTYKNELARDDEKALDFHKRACGGNRYFCSSFEEFVNETVRPKDAMRAVAEHRWACERSWLASCLELGEALEDTNREEARRVYARVCEYRGQLQFEYARGTSVGGVSIAGEPEQGCEALARLEPLNRSHWLAAAAQQDERGERSNEQWDADRKAERERRRIEWEAERRQDRESRRSAIEAAQRDQDRITEQVDRGRAGIKVYTDAANRRSTHRTSSTTSDSSAAGRVSSSPVTVHETVDLTTVTPANDGRQDVDERRRKYLACVAPNRECMYGTSAACSPAAAPTGPFAQGSAFAQAQLAVGACSETAWNQCYRDKVVSTLPSKPMIEYLDRATDQLWRRLHKLPEAQQRKCPAWTRISISSKLWLSNAKQREFQAALSEVIAMLRVADEVNACVYYGEHALERLRLARAKIAECVRTSGYQPTPDEIERDMTAPPLPK